MPNLFRQEYQTELRSPTQSWARGMANRAGTKPGTGAVKVMLRGRPPSVRTPLFGPARYRLNRPASSLRLPISLSKIISHSRARPSCAAAVRSLLPASLPRSPSRATAPSSPRRAPSPVAAALARCAPCPAAAKDGNGDVPVGYRRNVLFPATENSSRPCPRPR